MMTNRDIIERLQWLEGMVVGSMAWNSEKARQVLEEARQALAEADAAVDGEEPQQEPQKPPKLRRFRCQAIEEMKVVYNSVVIHAYNEDQAEALCEEQRVDGALVEGNSYVEDVVIYVEEIEE